MMYAHFIRSAGNCIDYPSVKVSYNLVYRITTSCPRFLFVSIEKRCKSTTKLRHTQTKMQFGPTRYKLRGPQSKPKPIGCLLWGERRQELLLRFSRAVSSFAISLPNAKKGPKRTMNISQKSSNFANEK